MKCFIDWLIEQTNQDDMPFEMSREDIIKWVEQIHENLLSEGKKPYDGRHYGNCTKKDMPCSICMYEQWLEEYREYCILYANNGSEM